MDKHLISNGAKTDVNSPSNHITVDAPKILQSRNSAIQTKDSIPKHAFVNMVDGTSLMNIDLMKNNFFNKMSSSRSSLVDHNVLKQQEEPDEDY